MCLFGVGGARRRPYRAPSSRHTQGFYPQLSLVPIACFLPWCSFFPSHKRLRFHLIYRTIVRLSFVWGSLVGVVQATVTCCCEAVTQSAVAYSEKCPYLCEHRKDQSDGIAIATKSIASCPPPAERFRGFPQTKCRGGTEWGKHREEGGKLHLIIFLEMPACPERGGIVFRGVTTHSFKTCILCLAFGAIRLSLYRDTLVCVLTYLGFP